MIDLRLRTKVHPDELQAKVGKVLTPDDYNLLLTRDARIRKPNGDLLCVYRRGVFPPELLTASYPTLHELRKVHTDNRGAASGTRRLARAVGTTRTQSKPISSAVVGAIEATGAYKFCRLTAWTGRETAQFADLWPLFRTIGDEFARLVPDRHAAQMAHVRRTQPEWVIPETPFTTITVNNTYPTGVHTDKGDLHEGFSNLTVLRRGSYSGGVFVFPEYRIGVDMADGDLLLMDAHEWHGNTAIKKAPCTCDGQGACGGCQAERISIVCYFRSKMVECGTWDQEHAKALARAEKRTAVGS